MGMAGMGMQKNTSLGQVSGIKYILSMGQARVHVKLPQKLAPQGKSFINKRFQICVSQNTKYSLGTQFFSTFIIQRASK